MRRRARRRRISGRTCRSGAGTATAWTRSSRRRFRSGGRPARTSPQSSASACHVKNQYFGDRRDLLKYDLLLTLVESHGAGRLTFIPMLTPNDDSREGRLSQTDRRGHRAALFDFLKESIARGDRDVRQLRQFMSSFGVDFMAYRDDAWFVHGDRGEYFDALPDEYLRGSVIFIDPDIGLETNTWKYRDGRGPEKYLLYPELLATWAR